MEQIKVQRKISEKKKQIVDKIINLSRKYAVIGVVDMQNLPAKELQIIRSNLRGKVEIFMAKKRLIKIAFEQLKEELKNITNLEKHLKGMPALIFTNENPFKLYKILEKGKSPAPIKAGQIAPKDIVVKAGPTPFSPGPIIGELGSLGIKTMVDKGKVVIKDDKVVVKEGESVSEKVASLLNRLGIKPVEIGLNLKAVYENGLVLEKDVLSIDEQAYLNMLNMAIKGGIALSLEIGYATKENIEMLITKAHNEAMCLCLERYIINKENANLIITKLINLSQSLKSMLKLKSDSK